MTTKLTLSIDSDTIERAKILSRRSGKSISKIVQDYLNSIAANISEEESATEMLSGLIKKDVSGGKTWKEIKEEHLRKKYGV